MTNPPRKGICCPKHPRARLYVVTIRKVAAGIVVRYRQCRECGWKVTCEERIRPQRRSTK